VRSPARFFSSLFFYLLQYRIPNLSFVLRGRRIEGLAGAKPFFAFFFLTCFFIQYRIPILSFVLRGRRIEGLAGAKPLYELPRLLRLLLGSVFAYGSLGC